jgi:hypothetical protein
MWCCLREWCECVEKAGRLVRARWLELAVPPSAVAGVRRRSRPVAATTPPRRPPVAPTTRQPLLHVAFFFTHARAKLFGRAVSCCFQVCINRLELWNSIELVEKKGGRVRGGRGSRRERKAGWGAEQEGARGWGRTQNNAGARARQTTELLRARAVAWRGNPSPLVRCMGGAKKKRARSLCVGRGKKRKKKIEKKKTLWSGGTRRGSQNLDRGFGIIMCFSRASLFPSLRRAGAKGGASSKKRGGGGTRLAEEGGGLRRGSPLWLFVFSADVLCVVRAPSGPGAKKLGGCVAGKR